jgi:hypothetical protein
VCAEELVDATPDRKRSGTPHGSIQDTGEGASTGVLPGLFGQVRAHPSGVMALHEAAEIDQRGVLDNPSPEKSALPGAE